MDIDRLLSKQTILCRMNDTLIQKIQSGQRCIERVWEIHQKNRSTFFGTMTPRM